MMTEQVATRAGITAGEVAALVRPFRVNVVQFRAGSVYPRERPTRAQALAYIEARDAMQRLDEVVPGEWSFGWTPDGKDNLNSNDTHAWIEIRGVRREDAGEAGEGEYGNTRKAAVSDGFKRCAVQWGVGRYLYYLPKVWVGYDADKKQLTELPQIPIWATPEGWDAAKAQEEGDREAGVPEEERKAPEAVKGEVQSGGNRAGTQDTEVAEEIAASDEGVPTSLAAFREKFRATINPRYTRPATEPQQGTTVRCLEALFVGVTAEQRTNMRYDLSRFLVGKQSSKDFTSGEASAFIEWAIVGKDEATGKTDYTPRLHAVQAAGRVITWLATMKGQQPMVGVRAGPHDDEVTPF